MKRLFKTNRKLEGEFTIEAAILVPLVLAVIFLLLQTVIFLHDTVAAEAWVYREAWKARWNQEQETECFEYETAPMLAVLHWQEESVSHHWWQLRREDTFQVCLLPGFVRHLFDGQPDLVIKGSTEKEMDHAWFLQLAGAVIEEWRD